MSDPIENEILLAKLKTVGEGPAQSWFRCRQETESKTLSLIQVVQVAGLCEGWVISTTFFMIFRNELLQIIFDGFNSVFTNAIGTYFSFSPHEQQG